MARRSKPPHDLSRAVGIADLRAMAERRLPGFAFEYLDGGAEDDRPDRTPGSSIARSAKTTLLASDVIYLSGGNTYYFLHHLRRSGPIPVLREFVARGGVLAGLSAGAILMTPHIGLAGYPSFDRDENDVGLRNEASLALVDFALPPVAVFERHVVVVVQALALGVEVSQFRFFGLSMHGRAILARPAMPISPVECDVGFGPGPAVIEQPLAHGRSQVHARLDEHIGILDVLLV